MALTPSDTEYASDSDEDGDVFFKLSNSNLITMCQELIDWCHEKARHMKSMRKYYDLLKDELTFHKDEFHDLHRDYNDLIYHMLIKFLMRKKKLLQNLS